MLLSHLYAKHIGFVLLPGCHDADLVNMQTLFSFHPRNRCYFLGDSGTATPCQSGLDLVTTANLSEFRQHLDVLVIVGCGGNVEQDTIEVLKELAVKAERVIAVGEGVMVLAKTRLLSDHRARCAQPGKSLQKQLRPLVGEVVVDVDDDNADGGPAGKSNNRPGNRASLPTVCESGKFVTAGPCTGAIEAALLVLSQLRGTFVASLAELSSEYAPTVRFSGAIPVRPDDLPSQPPLRVGVLLTKDMFLPDVIGALSVFKALPNCQVVGVVVEERDVPTMFGPTVAASATTTTTLKDCPQLDVFVVGLIMPWVLCHSDIVEFVRNQARGCKAMVGVCAGALLLGSAGLLEGINATTNFQMKPLLPSVGATTIAAASEEEEDDLVVVDDNKFIFTAGPVIGSYEAAILVVQKLYGDGVAAHIEQNFLCYQYPHPPFNVGIARNASRGLLLAAKIPVAPLNPIFRYCARKGLAKTHHHRKVRNGYEPKSSNKATIGMAAGAGIFLMVALVVHKVFLSPTTKTF